MADKDEILRLVKEKGPIIPNQIKKILGGETYLISALLSELTSSGLVKVSNTKIGGSPTYYAPGQEYKLENLKKYLNEKDGRTFELLKERKVLRDKTQEMLIRVSIRNIKDFAKPVEVNVKGEKEIFWKWYLTPANEVEGLIQKQFKSVTNEPQREERKPEPPKENVREEMREEKQEILKKEISRKEVPKGDFTKALYDFFEEKKIEITKEEVIRKDSDLELQIVIPSAVGKMDYFCKAKSKKKCNDGDLSSAFLKGQLLKLPVIFITSGDVTKKAEDMLGREYKGMILKKI
ncbi:hypothetical protein H8D36_05015 [archaeon]|nr:hypothetical protein [archaeon]MBL7056757.1 hypothetical protein [Candidatus Woesearchaeota archaeon]